VNVKVTFLNIYLVIRVSDVFIIAFIRYGVWIKPWIWWSPSKYI